MLEAGDYVQTLKHDRRFQTVPRGSRGTVLSLEGDWATVELPSGGRFQSHHENLTRLVRATDIKREELLV